MAAATTSVSGYLTSTDWNTFNNKGSGTVTSVAAITLGTTGTDLSSSVATGTTTPIITLNVPTASATNRGALSSTDWTTFNNKQPAGSYLTAATGVTTFNGSTTGLTPATATSGAITLAGTLVATNGGTGVAGTLTGFAYMNGTGAYTAATSAQSLTLMGAATTTTSGYLTSTDWNTFNSKGSGTVTTVTGTAPVVSSGGTTPAISMAAATTSVSGYLTSTDWTTFNNKGSGTVTSVGFTGGIVSVGTATTTPAFTIAGTSGGIPYFSSGTTWATSAALASGALVQGGGAGVAPSTITTGTGVVTALGINTGTAGSFVVNGGALGIPSGGTVTNLTGTASININGTVGATTASTGAFTTLSSTSDATINGQTIGKGLASVATNTAHGTSALAAITTGNNNVGLGYQALAATTGGNFNIALGSTALAANTSGGSNTAIGYGALSRSVSGSNNISIGQATLPLNTIGSSNVAVGHQAGNGLTSGLATLGTITAGTGYTNGTYNTVAFSYVSGPTASNYGLANVTVAGGVVTAVVIANVGSGWTGTGTVLTVANTLIGGTGSGFSVPVATLNSGSTNTLIGYSAGSSITTGSNNTLIGGYTGNSAPLSNTGSNYIVLSNGTPTIGAYFDGTSWTLNGLTNVTAVNATGTTAPSNGIYSPATSILALSANSAERLRVNGTGSIGLSGANYGTAGQVLSSNGSTSAASWITVGGTGTVTSVAALTLGTTGTDLSSTVATGTTTPVITLNVPTASATNRGALSSADWTTFNNKQPSGTYVTSVTGTAPVVSSGGTTPAISMAAATTSVSGYLTSTDWTTFNNKQPAGSYLTAVTADTPLSGSGTSGSHLVIAQSNTTTSGYLSFTDWNTFNGKGNGTVTSVGGTGTVNGITLTGTVTASGNLTLGGTLDLSSPPSIGNTAPNSIAGTTVTANSFIPNLSTVPTNGLYLPAANNVGIATNSGERMRIDSSGNLGLGVTPSAWNSLFKAIQVGAIASFGYDNSFGQTVVTNNAYGTGSAAYTYLNATSLQAARYEQKLGTHAWFTAPSGTAGNPITFTQAMTLFASGGLSLGNTTDPGATNLSVTGTIASASTVTGTTVTANASVTTSGNQGAFSYGTLGYSDTNILASYASSVAGYNQIVLQNTSNNAAASTNFNVSNDFGTSTTNYGEFGINSSTFTGTGSFNSAGYVYLTSASTDLAIGTYGANAVHFVTNSSAIDAGSISSTGQWAFNNSTTNTTATALVHLGAGTATANTAPLKLTSGTNLTTAEAGTVEYDGSNFYSTADTSQGRNINLAVQQFQLSAAGSALSGATQNYFGATSAASLAAASTYDIECYCYFLKTTSGTVQWIPTVSSAFTVGHCALEYTPVTGFTTTVITGAMVLAEATIQTSTTLTNVATASLTSAVYHVHKMKIRIRTNAACNFRLNATISAGSITPQAGSFYTVRKVVSNAGNFVA